MLKYRDENIDPFSFFYYLAGYSAFPKSRARIYPSISEQFGVPVLEHLDRKEAFVFPTPSLVNVLFHDEGTGNPQLLWKLFRQAVSGVQSIKASDFEGALKIPRVALSKLTQALFLVNPEEFLSFDKTGVLPLGLSTLTSPVDIEWLRYREELRQIREAFPGCWPYEINLVAYLHNNNRPAIGGRQFFQVSTHLHEDDHDHWEDFRENNWVYTTERRSKKGWDDPPPDDVGHDYPWTKRSRGCRARSV